MGFEDGDKGIRVIRHFLIADRASGLAVLAPLGRINLNVYSAGRLLAEAGAIGHLCDFTPEAAYVKLMWVLGREKMMEKVRALMESDVAGEITARSDIAGY